MTSSIEILGRLIAEPTVSLRSNLDLIGYVQDFLARHGVASRLVHDETGKRANLHAVIGPQDVPGVMLSGHTDVVPVEGQDWSHDPFAMVERDGRLYGRGTADMKGFLACVMALVPAAVERRLARPIHIAFSYDEELGCIGVRRLIDVMAEMPVKPAFCIVGEPTSLDVAIGHKGKTGGHIACHGLECHSSLAPTGVNAIYMATDMIAAIRALQEEVSRTGARDEAYDIPYTTLHVGTIEGGTALNIVPSLCRLAFEIRNVSGDDPQALLDRLRDEADRIVAGVREHHSTAAIDIEIDNAYPGLDTDPDAEIVSFVKSLTGRNSHLKVPFGTEGGLFQQRLHVPTVVCGPGDIAQAHKPDEFIAIDQMARCDAFLAALLDRLSE